MYMGQLTFKQGKNIFFDNRTLYFITSGQLSAIFSHGNLSLEAGDAAGIFELFRDDSLFTYRAESDVTVTAVPIPTAEALSEYLRETPQAGKILFASALGQISLLLQQSSLTLEESKTLQENLLHDYRQYVLLCQKHQIPAQILPGFDKLKAPVQTYETALHFLYDGLRHTPSFSAEFSSNADLMTGFLYHCSLDCENILSAIALQKVYLKQTSGLYLNITGGGLLPMCLELLSRLQPGSENCTAFLSEIQFMLNMLQTSKQVSALQLQKCAEAFEVEKKRLAQPVTSASDQPKTPETAATGAADVQNAVKNSLEQILSYSMLSLEQKEELRRLLEAYRELPDKAATDDPCRRLYKKLTESFLTLYKEVALHALKEGNPPILVRMFLYFGYLDEELAGLENACFLYQAASSHTHTQGSHIYAFFDWLNAIYKGQKNPSRNEFDQEYSDVIHQQKLKGIISPEQEKEFLADPVRKTEYELDSMFPQVNKMTYGRISSYCPVFSAHNVLRSLSSTFVTEGDIMNCIQKIRDVDYSAFYRETIYSNPDIGIPKEFINVEAIPDFILMPNVGLRGAMWQEIENRRRTTSARMMLPIFLMEDLSAKIIHLTGEYRWEMCKRIQGARWNDMSELSLTSEYCDYIQFYRKNNELSPDTKEKIKNALVKTKNNYKEMFVTDYMSWIQYESAGSPRLNKTARGICFTYCPFSKEIRESLGTNPLYRELLDKYDVKKAQKLHHWDLIRQKMSNLRVSVPEELEAEYNYINK